MKKLKLSTLKVSSFTTLDTKNLKIKGGSMQPCSDHENTELCVTHTFGIECKEEKDDHI